MNLSQRIQKKEVIGIFFLIAILSMFSLWQLWEQDIFWQMRAGQELFQGNPLPQRDSWSYTAKGEPWFNFQWLGTVFIYSIFSVAGYEGLIAARALLTALLLVFCALISYETQKKSETKLKLNSKTTESSGLAFYFLLLSSVFILCTHRLQIRPELFCIVLFSALIWIWNCPLSFLKKVGLSYLISIFSHNIHPGLTPFFILSFFAFSCGQRPKGLLKAGLIVGFPLVLFAHPYWREIPSWLLRHIFYSHASPLANPDHQGLSLTHFILNLSGALGPLWLLFTFACGFAILRIFKNRSVTKVDLSHCLVGGLFLFFTLMSLNRDRVIPFQVLLGLPIVSIFLQSLRERKVFLFSRSFELPKVLAFIGVGIFLPLHLIYYPLPLGLKLSDSTFPISSANFISSHNLPGPIYHSPSFGNYMIWNMREYPVFVDTRETMYSSDFLMLSTPDALEKYKINTVWLSLKRVLAPIKADPLRHLFPKESWSLVYFDNESLVMVRSSAIQTLDSSIGSVNSSLQTYDYLRPNLLPLAVLEEKQSHIPIKAETARCLKNNSKNYYCLSLQLLNPEEDSKSTTEAKAQILSLSKSDPYAQIYFEELSQTLQNLEQYEFARKISEALGH